MYVLLFAAIGYAPAQDVITVTANDPEISDNLDLQAVASVFGDSKNLEDFEHRLNDPYTQISNLDLNRDGYVDYLRVVELSEHYTHLIVIQAVIGNDLYQDVATIEVEKDRHGITTIQVVGDAYIYGPGYIIEPVYVYRPLIVVWFWGPYYRPWHSPYYWSYYPHFYRPWHPYRPHIYRTNVYAHINIHNTYHYTNVRKCGSAVNMYHRVQRNDYGNRHPENSFAMRNNGISNRSELNRYRNTAATNTYQQTKPARANDNKVYKSPKAVTVKKGRNTVSKNKPADDRQKPAVRQQSTNPTRTTSYDAEKRQVQSKRAGVSSRSYNQQESARRISSKDAQRSNTRYENQSRSAKQYSGKQESRIGKSSGQSRTSTVNKSNTNTQVQSRQDRKPADVKSRSGRR